MRIREEIIIAAKAALFGAIAGAAALAAVGFGWSGWVTREAAENLADRQTKAAVVHALAPVCVDNFRREDDAVARLVRFQQLQSFDRTLFIEKGGWAVSLGGEERNAAVMEACAEALVRLTVAELQ